MSNTDHTAYQPVRYRALQDDAVRRQIATLPKGLDYQGRFPEAAECCTEIGADEPVKHGKWDGPALFAALIVRAAIVIAIVAAVVSVLPDGGTL